LRRFGLQQEISCLALQSAAGVSGWHAMELLPMDLGLLGSFASSDGGPVWKMGVHPAD
jgi:hypothetical protein